MHTQPAPTSYVLAYDMRSQIAVPLTDALHCKVYHSRCLAMGNRPFTVPEVACADPFAWVDEQRAIRAEVIRQEIAASRALSAPTQRRAA